MTDLLSARDAIEHAIDQLTADHRDRDAIPLANAWANIAHVLFLMEETAEPSQGEETTRIPLRPGDARNVTLSFVDLSVLSDAMDYYWEFAPHEQDYEIIRSWLNQLAEKLALDWRAG